MPRGIDGNRALHLNEHVIPETLFNKAINNNAAIREWKLRFWDYGHDHTGGPSGALIDLPTNLIRNSNFEHDISRGTGTPDFWLASGSVTIDIVNDAYIGTYACKLDNNNPINYPSSSECLYQDIPSPYGIYDQIPPSGNDFSSKLMTLGCWAKGNGTLYIGHNDTGDHWNSGDILSDEYEWLSYRFTCSDNTDSLSVMFCPVGTVYLDNVKLAIGTRLNRYNAMNTDEDIDAWRRHNNLFNNVEDDGIRSGDVVAVSTDSYASVLHPMYCGQGGVVGVAVADSECGSWVPVCNLGYTMVNVIRTVSYGDMICAATNGYAMSDKNITAEDITLGDVYSFATALEEKDTDGEGQILAFIHPKPTRQNANDNRRKAVHLAPEYDGAVEHAFDGDNPLDIPKGWDMQHNYYIWNVARAQELLPGVGAPIASEDIGITGHTNSIQISGAYTSYDINLISDEVYQQALIAGQFNAVFGTGINDIRVKIFNDNAYVDKWVDAATDPGEIVGAYTSDDFYSRPVGNFPVGGFRTPTLTAGHGTIVYDDLHPDGDAYHGVMTGADFYPVGADAGITPSGWSPVGFDLRNGMSTGNIEITGTGNLDIVSTGVIGGTGFITYPTGVYSTSNSIVIRVPVPHDHIAWLSTGFYVWNMATAGAYVQYQVYDVDGVLITDSDRLTNTDWTRTELDISAGNYTPNEWFTVYTLFNADGDSSAYSGEMSMYYYNYAS